MDNQEAKNAAADKLAAVYQQLCEGVSGVDPNKLFEAAERIVRAEEERATYRETWGQSPFAGTASDTKDTTAATLSPIRTGTLVAEEIEAKQPERAAGA